MKHPKATVVPPELLAVLLAPLEGAGDGFVSADWERIEAEIQEEAITEGKLDRPKSPNPHD